ncbi:MAG: hypothetical protein SGCHY_001346 [Lobulomycetales sp.]
MARTRDQSTRESSLTKRISLANLASLASGRSATTTISRAEEMEIVPWEDDELVDSCPFCSSTFNLLLRKHHCRLCGRIVCHRDSCISEIPVPAPAPTKAPAPAPTKDTAPIGTVKACRACRSLAFRRRTAQADTALAAHHPLVALNSDIQLYRRDIESAFETYNDALAVLCAQKVIRGDDAAYADAARKRARLVDLLKSLEGRARAVLALGTAACTRAEAVCSGNAARDAMDFVQRYMFSMRMMPRATAQAQALEVVTVDAEQVVSRREVYALEAQYAQVEGFVQEAISSRRLEEAAMLQDNLGEISAALEAARKRA